MTNYLVNNLTFDPSKTGYNAYRQFHSDCHNGYVHAMFMPWAVVGFFTIMYGIIGKMMFNVKDVMALTICISYIAFDSWYFVLPAIAVYHFGLSWYLRKKILPLPLSKTGFIVLGTILLTCAVSIMEFVGHGYFEHHHSHLPEVLNSIYHTPLYTIHAFVDPWIGNCS